ncbi:hypothetical protein DESC_710037 [Desulfosarcina cetonica]|nr:hypothetical protein DESC_710037 [Desulfosarcina cetonica]
MFSLRRLLIPNEVVGSAVHRRTSAEVIIKAKIEGADAGCLTHADNYLFLGFLAISTGSGKMQS